MTLHQHEIIVKGMSLGSSHSRVRILPGRPQQHYIHELHYQGMYGLILGLLRLKTMIGRLTGLKDDMVLSHMEDKGRLKR